MSSWRLDGREFHAFGPEKEKLRSPNFSFNVEFILKAAGGSQSLTTRQVSDGCHHVRQVRRTATNSHQVHEHAAGLLLKKKSRVGDLHGGRQPAAGEKIFLVFLYVRTRVLEILMMK